MFAARFQSFDETASADAAAPRIAALRAALKQQGLDGFVVPRADRHQNEYVPANEERIAYLTGFTGSAGFLLVLADKAVLFTDGRYTLQAREQTDPAIFTLVNSVETAPSRLDRAASDPGHAAWLRSLASYRRGSREAGESLQQGRSRARAGRTKSGR